MFPVVRIHRAQRNQLLSAFRAQRNGKAKAVFPATDGLEMVLGIQTYRAVLGMRRRQLSLYWSPLLSSCIPGRIRLLHSPFSVSSFLPMGIKTPLENSRGVLFLLRTGSRKISPCNTQAFIPIPGAEAQVLITLQYVILTCFLSAIKSRIRCSCSLHCIECQFPLLQFIMVSLD